MPTTKDDIIIFENQQNENYHLQLKQSLFIHTFDGRYAKAIVVCEKTEESEFSRIKNFLITNQNSEMRIVGSYKLYMKLRHDFHRYFPNKLKYIKRDKDFELLFSSNSRSFKITKSNNDRPKILIVDDSSTIRKVLRKILSESQKFEEIYEAEDPIQAQRMIPEVQPDVISLDIHMPEMNGVELLEKINPIYQIPTVMISSLSIEDGPLVLSSLEKGAVDYIQKPSFSDIEHVKNLIVDKLSEASNIQIRGEQEKVQQTNKTIIQVDNTQDSIITIGASTGGTEAIKTVLSSFPNNIPPVLIVQHIPKLFSKAFADRLNSIFSFHVVEAKDGEEVLKDHVYIAPGGRQMGIKKSGAKYYICITDDPPVNRHSPSVDYLFDSITSQYKGKVVASVLTGMGNDGAKGLLKLKDQGHYTFAQDEETSVVYGMPKECNKLGAALEVLPLGDIGESIMKKLR